MVLLRCFCGFCLFGGSKREEDGEEARQKKLDARVTKITRKSHFCRKVTFSSGNLITDDNKLLDGRKSTVCSHHRFEVAASSLLPLKRICVARKARNISGKGGVFGNSENVRTLSASTAGRRQRRWQWERRLGTRQRSGRRIVRPQSSFRPCRSLEARETLRSTRKESGLYFYWCNLAVSRNFSTLVQFYSFEN